MTGKYLIDLYDQLKSANNLDAVFAILTDVLTSNQDDVDVEPD